MRFLYSLLVYLATPGVFAWFAVRGLRDRGYWRGWSQRLGFHKATGTGAVHLHASSMGEVNAAAPLAEALLERSRPTKLLITTTTATGLRRVRTLFGDRVEYAYLPIDLPGAVARFLRRRRPTLVIIMETEIWPNLYGVARRRGIPLVLINARMSERSLRSYRRWPGLLKPALEGVRAVLAQSERDANRYAQAGARPDAIHVTGNLKFDVALPEGLAEAAASLREGWGRERPVITAGSTHEFDEQAILPAFRQVLEHHSGALLVLAPRHPERFDQACRNVRSAGLKMQRLSADRPVEDQTQCLVIDALGHLLRYYAAADIAFVGGTIAPVGGHNPLEPAVLGRPVLFGPHTGNIPDICEAMLESGGGLRVADAGDLAREWLRLIEDNDARRRMGEANRLLVRRGSGALDSTLAALDAVAASLTPGSG